MNKGKTIGYVISIVLLMILVYIIFDFIFLHNKRQEDSYKEGLDLLKSKKYEEAVDIFNDLSNYKNADVYEKYCNLVIDFPELREKGLDGLGDILLNEND